MNQQNSVNSSFPALESVVKRKRGHRRGGQSQNPAENAHVLPKRESSGNYGDSADIPPGFETIFRIQPQDRDTPNDNNMKSMVGQVVTGVIEAEFDVGYVLSVRIGDSENRFRGLVFKPGHRVPVSSENVVTSSLPMNRRNEVPFPVGNRSHQWRRRQSYGSPVSNRVGRSRARPMQGAAAGAPCPLETRGTLVPVVGPHMSDTSPLFEAPPVLSRPPHLAASKNKDCFSTQVMQEALPKVLEADRCSASQPCKDLITVAKKMQVLPSFTATWNESGMSRSKILNNKSGLTQEQVQHCSNPLLLKPVRAINSGLPDQSQSSSCLFSERSGQND